MPLPVIVTTITAVRPHGDNLSIVTVGDNEVVANRQEDGSFRWEAGEPVVYVPEGVLVPPDVLQERGYWDAEKGKGLLEGKKGNRVKRRNFAGFPSVGLLFKVGLPGHNWDGDQPAGKPYWIVRESLGTGQDILDIAIGDDVAEFLGITDYIPGN